jgi:hypothetical protein
MSKYKYVQLGEYIEKNKKIIKQKPFSSVSCVVDPQNSYNSLDNKIATVLCKDSGLPIGLTQINVKNNPPIDLPSTYSKKDTNKLPVNEPGEFAKYFVGGRDATPEERTAKEWNNVSKIYCNSRKLSYDTKTMSCK